jgi:hypothetical protein
VNVLLRLAAAAAAAAAGRRGTAPGGGRARRRAWTGEAPGIHIMRCRLHAPPHVARWALERHARPAHARQSFVN